MGTVVPRQYGETLDSWPISFVHAMDITFRIGGGGEVKTLQIQEENTPQS